MSDEFQIKVRNVFVPLIQSIVDKPEKVQMEMHQGEQTYVFEVKVDKSDIGKVIGKEGRMAKSLRLFLYSLSSKHQKRSVLEIVE